VKGIALAWEFYCPVPRFSHDNDFFTPILITALYLDGKRRGLETLLIISIMHHFSPCVCPAVCYVTVE
jgi:hypothetical protein